MVFTEMQEKINESLARVKVMVCHVGKNLNHSKFSKENLEKALHSLEGIPLVGEYKEDKGDFGGHGGKLEITDEGYKFVETTKPYGFIPFGDFANIRFETILDKDGHTEREWLVADAYIWYKRYPELEKLFEGNNNQSMEVTIQDCSYDDDGYYDIRQFNFEACCILGADVSPAMQGAKISGYGNFAEFKEDFKALMQESMEEIKSYFEIQKNSKSESEPTPTPIAPNTTSEITYEVLEQAYDVLKQVFEKAQEEHKELISKNESLSKDYEGLKEENKNLQETIKTFETEQRDESLEKLYSQFAELSEDEINSVREMDKDMSLEQVEMSLFALLGKKQKASFSKNDSKKKVTNKVPSEEGEKTVPYDGYFEKFKK